MQVEGWAKGGLPHPPDRPHQGAPAATTISPDSGLTRADSSSSDRSIYIDEQPLPHSSP
ncbi:MAG: hypothetical protein Q4G66_11115 [bacterium]|nr:hypothetical protein [bacterium]